MRCQMMHVHHCVMALEVVDILVLAPELVPTCMMSMLATMPYSMLPTELRPLCQVLAQPMQVQALDPR